jgi:uncharacterized protein (TIGR02246 family)
MSVTRYVLTFFFMSFPIAAQTQAPPTAKSSAAKGSMKSSEAEIRAVYDRWARAFKARDLGGIMSVYASDVTVVAYDVVPPLQFVGKDAYRNDYQEFLAQYDSPLDVEYRDMRIVAGPDVAFIHALERLSGTMKNGQESDIWIRVTSGLQKINGKWLIVHDHVSVPVDFETGKAVLDLKP